MSAAEGIGTRKEKSLHAALKRRYAGDGGRTEAEIGQYVCDAVSEDGRIVEVQTGNFAAVRDKIAALAARSPVTLVHPIAATRTIELRNAAGELLRTRKSPRKGKPAELFSQLIRAPLLPALPGLTIEIVMVEETELRVDDGKGSWRRKGVSISDRRLDAVRETIVLGTVDDYRRFLPETLPTEFGSGELAEALSVRVELARRALYVLKRLGLAEEVGKTGRAKRYRKRYAEPAIRGKGC